MLNTPHDSSHSRSREDRVRGSSVPVGTTEARSRRVETLESLSGPRMRGGTCAIRVWTSSWKEPD